MEGARTNWNDDRLDRLADQVDGLRRDMDQRFEKLEDRIDDRFDRLQTAMIITLAGILAAFGGAFLGLQL